FYGSGLRPFKNTLTLWINIFHLPLTAGEDACLQRQDPGGCQDYAMMWFFDTVQDECARFWYGGCDGNANRFETQEECENLCLTHIQ
uniref:BPTI/Kunitz inhibitor domain-containing protein n=1 Tax=Poecilia latipinna TaxID=48699 RepID=A0A3B3UH75_9TELE